MLKVRLHTSTIRHGVFWRAGSILTVNNEAEAKQLATVGDIVADIESKPESPKAEETANTEVKAAAKAPAKRSKK